LRHSDRSYNFETADLIDNHVTTALARESRKVSAVSVVMPSIADLETLAAEVDWSRAHNLQRLTNARRLIRKLFWAFEDKDAACSSLRRVSASARLMGKIVKVSPIMVNVAKRSGTSSCSPTQPWPAAARGSRLSCA